MATKGADAFLRGLRVALAGLREAHRADARPRQGGAQAAHSAARRRVRPKAEHRMTPGRALMPARRRALKRAYL